MGYSINLILVNDGSTDNSIKIIKKKIFIKKIYKANKSKQKLWSTNSNIRCAQRRKKQTFMVRWTQTVNKIRICLLK